MNSNHRKVQRILRAVLLSGLFTAAASAQTGEGRGGLEPQAGVTKLGAPAVAKWQLVGAITDRPGPKFLPPRGELERLYANGSWDSLFMGESQPHWAGDDGSFLPGTCLGGPARVMSVEFGMYVNPGPNGEASFDAHLMFYDRVDENRTPVNSGFLGGFIIAVPGIASGQAYTTGPIDLQSVLPEGILLPDESFFVDLRFYEPKSMTALSERATPMFSGTGVQIGSSRDMYWADADGNGQYDPAETTSFAGSPWLANFYLVLDGVIDYGCAADFNTDGVLNSADFFDFLAAFFGEQPEADFNMDLVVNTQDFFDYLTAFFSGCP